MRTDIAAKIAAIGAQFLVAQRLRDRSPTRVGPTMMLGEYNVVSQATQASEPAAYPQPQKSPAGGIGNAVDLGSDLEGFVPLSQLGVPVLSVADQYRMMGIPVPTAGIGFPPVAGGGAVRGGPTLRDRRGSRGGRGCSPATGSARPPRPASSPSARRPPGCRSPSPNTGRCRGAGRVSVDA